MRLFRPFAPILALFTLLAVALPAAAEEVRIKPGAQTLNAHLDLASGKALKDGVVLIVHGTLAHNDMETLKTLRGVLNDRGLNTLAINLSLAIDDRHGMYDCKTPHRHGHLDALDEISAWMDWLKDRGAGPVVLFGHSRGGNQAARFAAERGNAMISKLALLAPATWNAAKTAQGFEKSHGRPLAPDLAAAEALVKAGKGDQLLDKPGLLYCPTAKVSAASFVSYYRPDPRFDTPSILGEIKVPVLVMAGSNDTVVADLPEKMAGKADGAKVAFKVIDGADHFFLDLYAEDVGDAMAAFITGG
ncbi:alpha/beta fold hydrolase [Thalassospiraceae bacterium LMO-SO8]|nr:alpha/beta fold hydrolase [Alphaproteobacteria bacterium LMO-S08]WND75876.1 alpha/beta fold hydrolase [Thalassospiraceae bacterium LMO-SO8]